MPKRTVATIKQFDYASKEEYEKDIPRMEKRGCFPVNGLVLGRTLKDGEIGDSDEDCEWRYTAYFIKSDMM